MLSKHENTCLTSFLLGRKCVFCGHRKLWRTMRGYLKCRFCGKQKGRKKLKRELLILSGFHQQLPALAVSNDLSVSYHAVTRVYQKMRELLYHVCEIEGAKLSGQIEVDESYFGGRRKGQRGRGASGKSIVFGLLERDGRVYTRVVVNVSAPVLMDIIKAKTRKGSVYYTDSFKSYNSLKRFGKHHKLNHSKALAYKNGNHINGIEGFWSFAKHKLYNYHGVSKNNFVLYLKEMEWRFNHRKDNTLKEVISLYFGYVSD